MMMMMLMLMMLMIVLETLAGSHSSRVDKALFLEEGLRADKRCASTSC